MFSWRPQTTDKAVFMVCDERYLPPAACLAWQIATQSGERDFDILIVSETPLKLPPILIELGVENLVVRLNDELAEFPARRLPKATYLCIQMANDLHGRYQRLLYLDCDILSFNGDISRLLTVEMQGAAIAAVSDINRQLDPKHHATEYKVMNLPAAPYFNSGVMLYDMQEFGRQRVLDRCIAMARSYPHLFVMHDQSILNIVIYGDFAELSPSWNWQVGRVSPSLLRVFPIFLRHFVGDKKPFKESSGINSLEVVSIYASFFRINMPDASVNLGYPRRFNIPFNPWPDIRRGYRLWKRRKTLRPYLERFPSEWTVLPPSRHPAAIEVDLP